jgi:homoserine dehydrogenase
MSVRRIRRVVGDVSHEIGIGMIGCGVVGSQVARTLLEQGEELTARTGLSLPLRHVIVRDAHKARPVTLPDRILSTDPAKMLTDDRTRVVVELAGGIDDAKALTLAALGAGKDVVTANKALLALHGPELFATARRAGRCIAFEAAVAGGIPLIESIRRGLIGNRIDAVYGILNGTCNYILTRMLEDDASYAHALAEAHRLGYAEADPTLDVDGTDSAHKLVILASVAMRLACDFDRIQRHGIAQLELGDLSAGAELGYACKLLAIAKRYPDGIDLSVQPTFIPYAHPLASVSGAYNAVSVYGSPVGHTLFYGPGAGGKPTASAVIADIIDVATGNAGRTFEQIAVLPDQTERPTYRPPGENHPPWYIRVGLVDRPGGIGKIATVLGNAGISIATIFQHEPHEDHAAGAVPVVVTTRPAKDGVLRQALAAMTELDVVIGRPVCIPVLDEHVE